MKILMFSVGFFIFILYIVGYLIMINKQHKIQSRRDYPNYGMDKLDDFAKIDV
jgi:hypothetical protein